MKYLLGQAATQKIRELTNEGWEFMLHYGDHKTYCDIQEPCWEADFTKKLPEGGWDNHKSGYGHYPDEAVEKAYENISNGLRLNRQ